VSEPTCCHCGRAEDRTLDERGKWTCELRPYGPGGAPICFQCATASPERDATTKANFGALLEANTAMSPTGIVAIGEPDGPRPFDPEEADRD